MAHATEVPRLENAAAQLRRRADEKRAEIQRLQRELEEIEDDARTVARLVAKWPAMLGQATSQDKSPERAQPVIDGKVPVTELIDRYLRDTGKREFSAADVKHYIINLGYEVKPSTYNSIHEALRRRVTRRELTKAGSKFRVRE